MKKKIITLFILVMFLATHNTSAVTSSINSVIYGKETNSEYGHVLSYRNTGSEMLHREQGFSLANFYNDEKLLEYITLAPNDGIQSFEKGSVELMFQYNRQDSTLEKIREAGKLDFKFYVTLDGTTFNDATNQLVYNEATNTYKYNGDLKGYKLSFINKTDVHYLQEQIGFLISHGIKFNYENMNENQKAGKEKLASWLDSKEENIPPTGNYQNIYIIQPEIKGKIKYQDLNGTNQPNWSSGNEIANIPVNLYEKVNDKFKLIGTTSTNAQGEFIFSNYEKNGKPFYINDTANDLYIGLNGDKYKEWKVEGVNQENVSALDNEKINIGRITDISRYQDKFNEAFNRTIWEDSYKQINENGKKATDLKFMLTNLDKPVVKDKGIVQVYYVDKQGRELAKSEKLVGIVEQKYISKQKDIKGYKLKEIKGNKEGKFSKNKQTVTYIYDKDKTKTKKKKKIVKAGSESISTSVLFLMLGLSIVALKKKLD